MWQDSVAIYDDWRTRLVDQESTSDRLLEELESARATFQSALARFTQVAAGLRDLGLHHAEDACALRDASREFDQGWRAYRNVLETFADHVSTQDGHTSRI
jgi:hypothetical protein